MWLFGADRDGTRVRSLRATRACGFSRPVVVQFPLMRRQHVDRDFDGSPVGGPCDVEDRQYVLLVGEPEEVGFLGGRGRSAIVSVNRTGAWPSSASREYVPPGPVSVCSSWVPGQSATGRRRSRAARACARDTCGACG